jgi:hypothetical protein
MLSLVLPQSILTSPMSNQIRRDPNSNPKLSQEVAYREGYQTGRDSERLSQQETYSAREENSAASGLIIGLALASLAALAGGTIYFLNARNEPVEQTAPSTQVVPVPVPVPDNSQPRTSNKETTIIERTIDKTQKAVPVPQQPATNSDADAPKINIEIPTPQQQGRENETNPSPVEPQQQESMNQTAPSPVEPLPNEVEPQQQESMNQAAPSPVEPLPNQTEPESSNNNE